MAEADGAPIGPPKHGWFVAAFGWPSVLVFLGGHLLYGLLTGGLYASLS